MFGQLCCYVDKSDKRIFVSRPIAKLLGFLLGLGSFGLFGLLAYSTKWVMGNGSCSVECNCHHLGDISFIMRNFVEEAVKGEEFVSSVSNKSYFELRLFKGYAYGYGSNLLN